MMINAVTFGRGTSGSVDTADYIDAPAAETKAEQQDASVNEHLMHEFSRGYSADDPPPVSAFKVDSTADQPVITMRARSQELLKGLPNWLAGIAGFQVSGPGSIHFKLKDTPAYQVVVDDRPLNNPSRLRYTA